jgi:methyl-accepting chemotaxis protein
MRLRTAIETGKSEWKPEVVEAFDQCEFGKWLYALPDSEKRSQHWERVQAFHSRFHSIAGKILRMAIDGHKMEADEILSSSRSEFSDASAQLTNSMVEWKKIMAG